MLSNRLPWHRSRKCENSAVVNTVYVICLKMYPVIILITKFSALESIIEKLMAKLKNDLDLDENLPDDTRRCFFTKLQEGNESRMILIKNSNIAY